MKVAAQGNAQFLDTLVFAWNTVSVMLYNPPKKGTLTQKICPSPGSIGCVIWNRMVDLFSNKNAGTKTEWNTGIPASVGANCMSTILADQGGLLPFSLGSRHHRLSIVLALTKRLKKDNPLPITYIYYIYWRVLSSIPALLPSCCASFCSLNFTHLLMC